MRQGCVEIDPALQSAIDGLQSNKSDANYVIATFQDRNNIPVLGLLNHGKGTVQDIALQLPESDVAYALFRTAFTWEKVGHVHADTQKSIFMNWRPASIPFSRQRIIGVAQGQIHKLFRPYHATLEIETRDEVTEKAIQELLESITMRTQSNLDKPVLINKKPNVQSFLPTGTAADTMGRAKGAVVAFQEVAEKDRVLAQVREDDAALNWCLYRYAGKDTLVFHASGSKGVEEMKGALQDEHVMYGFFRVQEQVDQSTTVKFCFLVWQPEVDKTIRCISCPRARLR